MLGALEAEGMAVGVLADSLLRASASSRYRKALMPGEVIDVVHLPSQDLLEIRRPAGNAVLVPLVEELVPEIDLTTQYVVVADRPGLLDPEGAEVVPTEPAQGAGD